MIILFDIDGTLVRSHGYARSPVELAANEIFGVEEIPDVEYGGRTDRAIFRELIERMGFSFETFREPFQQAYYRHLEIAWDRGYFRKMPGIDPLLHSIRQAGFELGLLTGNAEPSARIKLTAAEVWEFFRFGGYGGDLECRNELARQLLERLKFLNLDLNALPLVVIGDTGADIECARAIGANVIAVATGVQSLQSLKEKSPDFLFDDLAETEQVMTAIRSFGAFERN